MKLSIELVPKNLWRQSLYHTLSSKDWQKIRQRELERADHRCEVCGFQGRLICHEIWQYNDQKGVRRLKGFKIVCSLCNFVHHFGLARVLASKGKLDLEAVIQHYMEVNGVSREMFDQDRAEALRLWKGRSLVAWKTDLGEYSQEGNGASLS